MAELAVSTSRNYETFCEQTDAAFERYTEVAAFTILQLTASDLARNAMVHPDGFLKLQIGPANGFRDGQVRLHFWIPGKLSTQQPHGHPWHLASRVVHGRYHEYLPSLTPDEEGDLRKYRISYPAGIDRRGAITVADNKHYTKTDGEKYTLEKGQTHYLEAGPMHMSSPDGLGAITLSVMSPRFANGAYFYSPTSTAYAEQVSTQTIGLVMDLVDKAKTSL